MTFYSARSSLLGFLLIFTAQGIVRGDNAATVHVAAATVPAGVVGTRYEVTLQATGGTPPYTWSMASGFMPPGLALAASGFLSGTPTKSGYYWLQVQATDSLKAKGLQAYSISIVEASSPPPGGGSGSGSGSGTGSGGGSPPPPATYTLAVSGGTISPAGTTSGNFVAGTTVSIAANPPALGQVFADWTGASVANAASSSTTLVMPAAATSVTANYKTAPSIPFPVSGHPRLWINQSDLAKLQGWANAQNPVYGQGMGPLLNAAISAYTTQFFPNGSPNPIYPDVGDSNGYTGLLTEQYSLVFAFNSLIDPSPAARILHAQRARNLLMYAMNLAALGPLQGAAFRDPTFAIYNRADFDSEAWPLIVDWIYNSADANGNQILTAQDKATIRTVFLIWANQCLNASTTGGDHPSPVGVENNPALLPGGNAYRMASNNFYNAHARLLTMMALAIDPVDDPAVNPSVPASTLGNSIRSYIPDVTGAWLYQQYAMLGDPSAVTAGYGLASNASVGLASGGLPPEGMLYGYSYAFTVGELLALKTAGFDTPSLVGPQAGLITAPVWGRFLQGFTASLVPAAQTFPGFTYLGPVYQMASYGDILRLWITPDLMQPVGLIGLLDQKNGDLSRQPFERWFMVNAPEGGSAGLISRITAPWSTTESILYYLMLVPSLPADPDPRPALPGAFVDGSQGRLIEHTNWTSTSSMFDFKCTWLSINHQQADAGQFELYRNGEWLTKEASNYDPYYNGESSLYHNALALQNACANGTPTNLSWFEANLWANGSEWLLGLCAGDPAVRFSVQPTYTFADADTTNLYNRPDFWVPANAALEIQQATRSVLWLKPDYVVIYDRATSKDSGLFKSFNLNFTSPATVAGNVATVATPGGQNVYVTSLLPTGAVLTASPIPNIALAWLEPSKDHLTIQDPANPADQRFLTVIEAADSGVAAAATTLIQSSAGTAYDGVSAAGNDVLFARSASAPFTGVTYTVPASDKAHYVTGLTASSGYSVIVQVSGGSAQITVSPGGVLMTDSAGPEILAISLAAP